jgi:HD-like signal output (HDOD) protein/ActR/RegA family two-component response regulator
MTTAQATILFVDDEVHILNGLRRKLADQDERWTMLFATSASEALAIMETTTVEVVVSDMRMPGMDGAALLDEVRRRYPSAGRFILSGFSEREAVFRTLGPAHQYFSKPCDTAVLVKAIERTLDFRRRLHAPELLALIAGTNAVPALPKALTQLFEELQSPGGSIAGVAEIIAADIALTAQVLKLVNSAYFFLPSKVSDILQAVRLLGFDLVRSVAAVAGVFATFRTAGIDVDLVQRLEERSLMIGAVARQIAQSEALEPPAISLCQCAGMLAHVGTLILFANRPDEMARLGKELDDSGGTIIDAERHHFATTHAELGACLLSLWGFTDTVVEAVLWHHAPSLAGNGCSSSLGATAIVHAAQHLVKPTATIAELDLEYLCRVVERDRIPVWADLVTQLLRECRS